MSVGDVPPFNPDLERDGVPAPPLVVEWRAQVAGSDGVLIASPEYAHSLPGSLKNAVGNPRCARGAHRSKRLTVSVWNVCGKASTSCTFTRE